MAGRHHGEQKTATLSIPAGIATFKKSHIISCDVWSPHVTHFSDRGYADCSSSCRTTPRPQLRPAFNSRGSASLYSTASESDNSPQQSFHAAIVVHNVILEALSPQMHVRKKTEQRRIVSAASLALPRENPPLPAESSAHDCSTAA